VLALTIAPLAYAAAINPSFRVAPFTAAIVLLISGQLGEGPVESALYRLLEVALGGGVAVVVSLVVLPERAHGLGLDAAARFLDLLARLLPKLLAGFTQRFDVAETTRMQQEAGRALAAFQAIAAEANRERMINLVAEPDPAPLARTLLRLRHDVVIIGRGAAAPLPEKFAKRLGPPLARVAECMSKYLHESAGAPASRRAPPPLKPMKDALAAYNSKIAALRSEGLTRTLSIAGVEQLFTLGFALEQTHRNSPILSAACRSGRGLRGRTDVACPARSAPFRAHDYSANRGGTRSHAVAHQMDRLADGARGLTLALTLNAR
jgi:uncharacterized membrane protein YccC